MWRYNVEIHTIVVLPETARGPSTSALSGSKINTQQVPNESKKFGFGGDIKLKNSPIGMATLLEAST